MLFFPDQCQADKTTTGAGQPLVAATPSNYRRRPNSRNYSALLEILGSATRTLDVCVYTISAQEISRALIGAHERGVAVRVVTDGEQVGSSGSCVERLRRVGIQVRTDSTSYFMHHKFALVDGRCLLSGSLNWTAQGAFGNQENVIVTSSPELVGPFLERFKALWTMYDPASLGYSELQRLTETST